MSTAGEGRSAVADIGHIVVAVGIGLLCWAVAHWLDERLHYRRED